MKNLKKLYVIIAIILFQFSLSCKKMVEVVSPRNQLITSQVFADSADATAAVLGMYLRMVNTATSFRFANGGITLYTGLTSDELSTTTGDPTEIEFYSNSITRENAQVASLWTDAYRIINQANACIEGITASSGINISTKNQLLGESKVVRAFIYFNLINLYGAVPFVSTTDYRISATLPRLSKNSVYQKIIEDLLDARQLLTVNYPTSQRVRPNRYAAIALLSRVYLYQGNWAAAESAASEILNSNSYSLLSNLNNVFLAGSGEAIWQIPPAQALFETAEGNRMVPTSPTRIPRYPINNFLLTSFEPGDIRKLNWLKFNTIGGQLYYYAYKYKLGFDGNTTPLENYMIFRLAEQYLIRAEARVQQNNLSGAIADLNVIRNRAGLTNTTAVDQASIIIAVQHERQIELFCEWGHRWYDLNRTNKADAVLGFEKAPNWQTTDALFPIPFSEILLNPALTQNSGY
jgi:hypothetical protein